MPSAGVSISDVERLDPAAVRLLPMLYVAWADGVLSDRELETISQKVRQQSWLDDRSRDTLCALLDPAARPTAQQLCAIRSVIRRFGAGLPAAGARSLAQLGAELARADAGEPSAEAAQALAEIEDSLGVIGPEAVQELVAAAAPEPPLEEAAPRFDVAAMTRVLDGKQAEARGEVRRLLREPTFRHTYGLETPTYRERVLSWARFVAVRGLGSLSYPKEYGGRNDLRGFMATFETLAYFDLSLVVKYGVQFGLFGGGLHQLGTRRHHDRYLRDAGTLDLPGCFAMTETGHGSNVRDIETTAQFDRATDEFVINTPNQSARKDYIGNAAQHGRLAIVFAQLVISDENYGVHAFLVPIRDDDGTVCDGIGIEDCGEKLGLNGVDNGRIWFEDVRIPRENLLDRFGQVGADGEYTSAIAGASPRFFTMLGTLVGGRISVAGAALSAAKVGLTIAIRYGAARRQFGPSGKVEQVLLDYRTHQRRLMPRLATAYAVHFALDDIADRYANRTDDDQREIETRAAGMKAFSTWETVTTLQECREACGGAGYLAVNRFAALKADTDVFTTFEGDNTVLMQLVAKGLLTEFKQEFAEMRLYSVVRYLGQRAATAVTELNPVVTRLTDEDHLRDPDFQLAAFRYREERLMSTAAQRLKRRIDEGMDSFAALNECQDHLVTLARASVERVIAERFVERVRQTQDGMLVGVLRTLSDLFALSRLEADRGWFLESGYFAPNKAKAIRDLVNQICAETRTHAIPLVDAFAVPEESLGAPIAFRA